MSKLRLRFSKTGTAKYISHLDLIATMTRALRRAGVELEYSHGFNPHPYLSAALPLPVGCSSLCELLDLGVVSTRTQESFTGSINAALPVGLKILDAYVPVRNFKEISWIELDGLLYYDNTPQHAVTMLTELFSADSIIISKKTKRGISEVDIIPHIRDVAFSGDNVIKLSIKVSAQNPSIGAESLICAINGGCGDLSPDHSVFTRMEIYDGNMKIFR